MSEKLPPKTPQELGISDHDWVILADSYLFSRDIVMYLRYSELAIIHQMNIDHLEKYFGMVPPAENQQKE